MDYILAIHRGVHESPPWKEFLTRMDRALACPSTIAVEASDGSLAWLKADPGLPFPFDAITQWDADRLRRHVATQEPARADARLEGVRILPWVEMGKGAWLITAGQDASGAMNELIRTLVPHFAIALRTLTRLEERRIALIANRRVIERLDIGILTLGGDGRVLGFGPQAQRIIASIAGIDIHHGKLRLTDRVSGRALEMAIQRCIAYPQAPPRAFALSQDPPSELLVVPAPSFRVYTAVAPAVILYIHRAADHPTSIAALPARLRELFDLTPLESEIAALLAQGQSVRAVAERLGITQNTTRGYLKSLFAKTGVHRQAELVRLILRSIGTIA
ncbi:MULTISPECIES: helix-turn-helix transcriptional regulator [unclassified Sphingobium]|uniref:helix-turn-helix transcriptional regulator n=1 Tax=unclassified Sphingobium TaxID=2611147 RepID=UPI000D15C05C|nr:MULTISPECIES: helix-turn-helix transcriptional regulator [unclassified Sphingobium]PSO12941.1 hypothetical protein C7E20_04120 [Sphingobium sp. AEW4]TWD05801.1 regulatory LuxR family protein [Sphingobium sp. AEW010]TWD23354.1 regulatory LuxR family protein [Sphingobium sp. AEW013]TWD25214.1 regulatory LuxR family protein [Sphingobium sp. AEW001]